MRRTRIAIGLIAGSLLCGACLKLARQPVAAPRTTESPPPLQPPLAPRDPIWAELHGERRIDDYAWMRNRDTPEVLAYLEDENTYTRAMMETTAALQKALYAEFLSRIQQTDEIPKVRRGDYAYYSRTEEGKQYPLYCRKRAEPEASEEIILDLNLLAAQESYLDLGSFEVSDDGNLLAYSLDNRGFREYTLYIKDLRSDTLLPERIAKVSSVAWGAGDRTLFYTADDAAKRAYRLYRHTLGKPADALVREEADQRFSLQVWRSRSKACVFVGAFSQTASEIAFIPAKQPERAPQLIAQRREQHEYHVDHRGELFYIRTNDKNLNFRLVTAPMAAPGEANWRELMPGSDAVMLEDLAVFRDYYVVHEREGGLPYLRVRELAPAGTVAKPAAARSRKTRRAPRRPAQPAQPAPSSAGSYRVEMPEPVYELHAEENPEFESAAYRFSYESLTTPTSYYDYRVRDHSIELIKRTLVLAEYDPARYRAERIHALAPDGTQIPISLVYRADKPPGPRPMLLEVYGAYGYPYPTTFSSSRVSLLDRGFIYAIAHVRGGGELGQRWHDEGRVLHKRNSIDDFIAVADHLIASGYTAPDRLAVEGASAGGLLVASVLNQRPELFKAALLDVPFVDVLNTMSDPDLPLTVGEYEEWGNPNVLEQYHYIKSYCPYSNIRGQAYPALLVKTSYDDSEVMYWEPAKYVAKLRAVASGERPILLWVNLDAGHGGPSGRYDQLRDRAFDFAFLLAQLGFGSR